MLKKVSGIFIAMSMILFSCAEKMDTGNGKDGMVNFTIKTSIPQGIKTYASDNGGATNLEGANYDLRYIMEVWSTDGNTLEFRDYRIVGSDFVNTSVTFDVRLLAKQYRFVFWADFVTKGTTEDLFYSTSANSGLDQDAVKASGPGVGNIGDGLKKITMISTDPTNYGLSNDARDAFCGFEDIDLTSSDYMNSITLTRPFGKYRLISTDAPQNYTAGVTQLGDVKIDYATAMGASAEIYNTFDAFADNVTGDITSVTAYVAPATTDATTTVGGKPYSNVYVLAFDYVFAPKIGQTSVAFNATVKDASNVQIGYREISSIPIERNKLTTIIGSFFTNTALLNIIVDDMFNGEDVSNADQIAGDITSAGYTITIPDNTPSGASLTYIFTGKVDPAATITITDQHPGDDGVNYKGTLNIGFTQPNAATVDIITPQATVNFLGTVGTLNATTGDNTLKVLKNSNIGTLTVNAGVAEVYGKVGTAADGAYGTRTGKVLWGVANWDDIAAALARTDANDGIVLANNITGLTHQIMFGKDNYMLDGKGYTLSGGITTPSNASKNLLAIAAPLSARIANITVQNVTITNSLGNGMVAQFGDNITLTNVNLINSSQAGAVINGSKVKATGLHTEGNAWGGVNIDYPDAAFDFEDGTSTFDEASKVWADHANVNTYDVKYPSDWTVTRVGTTDYYYPASTIPPMIPLATAIANAATGSTLNLVAGATYNLSASLTIDKNITINGNGADIVFAGTQTDFSNQVTQVGDKLCYAALFIDNVNVTLNDVNLVISSVTPATWGGIILKSGTLNLNGGSVEGGQFSVGDPTTNGVALFQYDGTSVVKGAAFKNFSKGGIYVIKGTTDIDGCNFTATNGFHYSQNGIVLGYPGSLPLPTCSVTNCTFNDFHCDQFSTNPDAPSCGVISFVGDTPFQNNTFNSCDLKIADGNSSNNGDFWVPGK